MKFIHLSDLHIGKHLYHYNMKEDQEHILEEVIGYTEKLRPDAVVIAGDIYDKSVPSAEAVAVFDDFLTRLSSVSPQVSILIMIRRKDLIMPAVCLEAAASILRGKRLRRKKNI